MKVIINYFLVFIMILLPISALGAGDAFVIAPGDKYVSGCDSYKKALPGILQEAFDMAKAGLDTANSLHKRKGTHSDAYLFTKLWAMDMVNFKKGKDLDKEANSILFPMIQKVLGDVTAERINAIGAKLFCGGRALVWTTTAYDEETLKPTNMNLTEVLDDLPSGFQDAYWLPQAKAYAVLGGGGPGIDPCDLARAFTIPLEGIIVICPKYLFKTLLIKPLIPIQQTLQPYKANPKKIKQGDRLDSYYSISSVLLHEMTHMMNLEVGDLPLTDTLGNPVKKAGEDSGSYYYQACVNLGVSDKIKSGTTEERAEERRTRRMRPIRNADSYTMWSIGSYLNSVDWTSGTAEKKETKYSSSGGSGR